MTPDWLPYLTLALNLLIIPLVKILWDIRDGLTRLEARFESHIEQDQIRLERLERAQDART